MDSSPSVVQWFVCEISAKLMVKSESEPEDLPADIYAQLAEFLPSIDHLMDLEVQTFALPEDVYGSSDTGHAFDSEEAE